MSERRNHDAAFKERVGAQRFQLRAVGGAKVKADVITSHAQTVTRLTTDGNPSSGGEQ